MDLFTTAAPVTITTHKRMMPYLAQEITELGFEVQETFVTGVRLNATLKDCIRLNLNLRCASQILYSLKAFDAPDADAIYKQVNACPWEDILPKDGYFSITSNVDNPTITNTFFPNLRVKDAIVDRMREVHDMRPSTGSELKGAVVHLYWKEDEAEIFIDTSGDSLARHGYRKIPGRAPMLEALAAATIMATRWDRTTPFVNPMCGSGTLAIEAALIATNRRPGMFRSNYAFMHLIGYDEQYYQDEMSALKQAIIVVPGLKIIATDHHRPSVDNAWKNAEAAGVADLITFDECDFKETEVPAGGKGVMMMNPEYGERLGEEDELEVTYKEIGDFMKQKCGGYFGYVFTGNLDLAKKVGLKPKRKIEFYNSTIDCRLMEYELYEGSRRVPREEVQA